VGSLFSRILLTGDTETTEEEYMSACLYNGPLTVINVPKLHTEPRFRVPVTDSTSEVELALDWRIPSRALLIELLGKRFLEERPVFLKPRGVSLHAQQADHASIDKNV
jgi:hypothetical protein